MRFQGRYHSPKIDQGAVLIVPNPFSEKTTIQIQNVDFRFGVFEVFDLMGKKVLEKNFYHHEFEMTKVLNLMALGTK